jgi:branched-chain amino acid transport system substrate-binding protein
MKRKILIPLAILVVIIAAIAIYFTQKPKEPETIKIGAILPLTGELSFIGEHEKKSILLAESTYPSKYIKIIIEDNASNPKNALSAAQKLIQKDKVNIIITSPSFISEAVKGIVEKENIPHFIWAYHPTLPKESNLIFRLFVSSFDEAKMFVNFITKKKYKKVAFLRHMHPDAERAFREMTYPMLKKVGVEVLDFPFPLGTVDFRSLIIKIKEAKPELLVIQSFANWTPKIYKQIKESGFKVDILGDLNFTDIESKLDASALANIPFVGESFITTQKYEEFKKQYFEKYNSSPLPIDALCYDLIKILSEYAEQVKGRWDLENFLKYIYSNTFDGITGRITFTKEREVKIDYDYFYFDNNGNVKKFFFSKDEKK